MGSRGKVCHFRMYMEKEGFIAGDVLLSRTLVGSMRSSLSGLARQRGVFKLGN